MADHKHTPWQGSTDGTPWMQRTLIRIIRVCPLPAVYFLMALVIPFYMLSGKGFKASYLFFRKRMRYGVAHSFSGVYANEFNLGMVALDRFAAYAGKHFSLEVEGQRTYDSLSRAGQGLIMLSSHVGNHELAGYFLKGRTRINALVFPGETQVIREEREIHFNKNNVRIIPIQDDFSHIFALNAALANAEVVSISGDRCLGSGKTIRQVFLGEEAPFPMGPFALAAQRQTPIVSVFVMKTGLRRYKVCVEELTCDKQGSWEGQAKQLCAAYARSLEQHVLAYPHQWYNFYDFWK